MPGMMKDRSAPRRPDRPRRPIRQQMQRRHRLCAAGTAPPRTPSEQAGAGAIACGFGKFVRANNTGVRAVGHGIRAGCVISVMAFLGCGTPGKVYVRCCEHKWLGVPRMYRQPEAGHLSYGGGPPGSTQRGCRGPGPGAQLCPEGVLGSTWLNQWSKPWLKPVWCLKGGGAGSCAGPGGKRYFCEVARIGEAANPGPVRVASANCTSIKGAWRKLLQVKADLLMLQEVRCEAKELQELARRAR